jgi:hypothetical protein
MNNIINVTDKNINILNKEYGTNLTIDEMKKKQILYKIFRNIKSKKHINLFDNNIILNYKSSKIMDHYYKYLDIKNCHIGQLKLFYTLFEFLLLLKKKYNLDDCLIVYIGSAHGFNIYANNFFFKVHYLLYDPGKFDPRLYTLSNITIKNVYFGLDKIEEIKNHSISINKSKIVFISDIRKNVDEYSIMQDNLLNYKTILELKPVAFMLKFRVPYFFISTPKGVNNNDNYYKELCDLNLSNENDSIKGNIIYYKENYYPYIDGKIYIQLFASPHSAETRLINFSIDGKYKMKYYDIKKYDSNMYTFNLTRLFFRYDIEKIRDIIERINNTENIIKKFNWINNYENMCELILIIKYIKNYKNKTSIEKFNKIIKIYKKIYKLIPNIIIRRKKCFN